MRKTSIFVLICLIVSCVLMTCSTRKKAQKTATDFEIQAGVNVSHWLSQSDKRGAARENYITKADFDTIAAVGFDHVRIPVDEEQLWDEDGNQIAEAFELLQNAIDWSIAADVKAIVDLHIIRSHHFIADTNPLWTDPAEQQKLVDLWKQLSSELCQYPVESVAYEILNEAVADDPEDWNKLLDIMIASIRETEPNRVIVVGSNRWQIPGTFKDLKLPEGDRNIIMSFHFYTPMALTHHQAAWSIVAEYTGPVNYPGQVLDTLYYKDMSPEVVKAMREYANGYFDRAVLEQEMMPAIKVARQCNLPLYCGEFGVYPTIPEEIALRWYSDIISIFHQYGIAYSHWCYKGDFPIVDDNSVPNKPLVSVLTSKGGKK
jgi:endoglucanase